ncbi:hypothetical protein Tco_0777187, partial [Tanacetum coccineum]
AEYLLGFPYLSAQDAADIVGIRAIVSYNLLGHKARSENTAVADKGLPAIVNVVHARSWLWMPVSWLAWLRERQSQIVAGNPMVGQNVSNGSTSVEGGVQCKFASDTTSVILQLALEFGIVTELVLLKTPYERRPCTGKRTQGPFSWGPAVGGEGVCTRLTLPNVEISWPLLMGNPWEILRNDISYPVKFYGKVVTEILMQETMD